MRATVGPAIAVKAAGGVRSLDALLEVAACGATRCGATATAAMLDEFARRDPAGDGLPLPAAEGGAGSSGASAVLAPSGVY